MESTNIDQLLKAVGGFGRWQGFILFLATWSCIVAATNHVAIVFLGKESSLISINPISYACVKNHLHVIF